MSKRILCLLLCTVVLASSQVTLTTYADNWCGEQTAEFIMEKQCGTNCIKVVQSGQTGGMILDGSKQKVYGNTGCSGDVVDTTENGEAIAQGIKNPSGTCQFMSKYSGTGFDPNTVADCPTTEGPDQATTTEASADDVVLNSMQVMMTMYADAECQTETAQFIYEKQSGTNCIKVLSSGQTGGMILDGSKQKMYGNKECKGPEVSSGDYGALVAQAIKCPPGQCLGQSKYTGTGFDPNSADTPACTADSSPGQASAGEHACVATVAVVLMIALFLVHA